MLSLILAFVLTSGFGCKIDNAEVTEAMKPITLKYWRVWDGPDAFDGIIASYKQLHPFISIEYKKLRYDEFEKELIEALAEDRGPDMISIPNTWVKKYQSKISPLPEKIKMAYPTVKGTIKKEVINEIREGKSITPKEIRDNYLDTVYDDIVIKIEDENTKQLKEKIFCLPLSIDTLAMYYNKDLFNNAGIIDPPKYWNKDFQNNVKKLTKLDEKGGVLQSGAALGGSANIERSSDILSILMMQNGAKMMEGNSVLFAKSFENNKTNPGLEALAFYTDFGNPAKEVYGWNKDLNNSVDMFAQGNLAIMFGYAYHLPIIRAKAPKLNFSIAPLPQIEGSGEEINFANYWVETVMAKSKNTNEAWDFIQFAAKAENVKSFLEKTKKPTALRSLIEEEKEDFDIGVFAKQLLTAKSWYKGKDAGAMEKAFNDMIDEMLAADPEKDAKNIINRAASRVQQTID